MTITAAQIRRWVHRAIEGEPTPMATAERPLGWLCQRCGGVVPAGGDRTPHYVPGH